MYGLIYTSTGPVAEALARETYRALRGTGAIQAIDGATCTAETVDGALRISKAWDLADAPKLGPTAR